MKKLLTIILMVLLVVPGVAQVVNTSEVLIGSWTGKLKVGANALTLVLNVEQGDGYLVCTMDSPDQGAKGLNIYKEYLTDDSLSLKVTQIGATFRAKVKQGKMVGTFSQMGMNFPLTLEKGSYEVRRPQNPVPPVPYKTEEVSFVNKADNATLVGTLTYPVQFDASKQVPVVVMVTGSGLQNRDEEIFNHKPFLVIADYLARHGIASLRYDDRAFGASTGGDRIHNQATSLDYKRDAASAIGFLKSRNEFGKVGVLGHSEGGYIAFMLGSEQQVDFVISMAGTGVKGDIVLTSQVNEILKMQGQTTTLTTEQCRQNALSMPSDWMKWFLDYDPTTDISRTACPVFALNGDKDLQVISSLNLPAIKQALPQNKHTLVKEYEGLNHLFQHCKTGLPTEYNTIEETISEEVLRDIAQWILSLPKQ